MARRAQLVASAILALACMRCSLLLYDGDELTGAGAPIPADSGSDAAAPSDAASSVDVTARDATTDASKFPASAVVWPGNGHAYEVVVVPSGIEWSAAKVAAEVRGGHLVTITSAGENEFVYELAKPLDDAWTLDLAEVLGPWIGCIQAPGSAEPDKGFGWVTGEPFTFDDFANGQPDDSGGESACHFYAGSQRGATWNDLFDTYDLSAYVVEYE